jgi:hypothetical protein
LQNEIRAGAIGRGGGVVSLTALLAAFLLLSHSAHAQTAALPLGGPHGIVKSANGELLEGDHGFLRVSASDSVD